MTVYRLAWELIKHIAHGRGRDTVQVDIDTDDVSVRDWIDRRELPIADVHWLDDLDKVFVVTAQPGQVIQ